MFAAPPGTASRGNPTWCHDSATTNGVLLCGTHHRLVERGDWEVRLAADGIPDFHPPPWTDPTRQPRRNHLHHHPD